MPASIASIVGRACSFEPSARYQSAGQMADELSVALGETPCPQASGAHTRLSSPAFTQQMPSASSRLSPDRGDAGSRGPISPAVSPEGAHGGSGVSSSSDPKRSAKSRSAESGMERTLARVFRGYRRVLPAVGLLPHVFSVSEPAMRMEVGAFRREPSVVAHGLRAGFFLKIQLATEEKTSLALHRMRGRV